MSLFAERVEAMETRDACDHLERAAHALEKLTDAEWGKKYYAQDAAGEMVGVGDPAACCWCVQGLVSRLHGHESSCRLALAYRKAGGASTISLANDRAASRSAFIAHLRALAGDQRKGLVDG